MTDEQIIKALEWHSNNETHCSACPYEEHSITHYCIDMVIEDALDLINRQKAEIERLTKEQDRTVKDLTEFARTAYDIPFACKYCAHSIEDGRACLWKAEHEDEEEACLGRHFEYK